MKLGFLSTGLLAIVAVPAMAQDGSWMAKNGVYGSVNGGWTQPQDQGFGNSTSAELNDGYTGSAAVGVTRGNMRGEVEGLYQHAEVDSINRGSANGGGGNTELMAGMVNGYYDFKNSSYFTPYVGAGVGYGRVNFNDYQAGGSAVVNDDDDVMAYQGMAGVAYEFNPCWTFTGEYRYVGTSEAEVSNAAGANVDSRYQSHSVLAGMRYTF